MATFIPLDWELIEISGPDAQKYLQGQLTCDVNALAAGASTLTAHCDPKGKMTSIFRLLKVSEQQFFMLINKGLFTALDALKKYAVFSKVTFTPLDWQIVGVIDCHCGKVNPQYRLELDEQRAIFLNPTALEVSLSDCPEQWATADILAGLPHLTAATQNEFIPQALNLQAIEQAVSFSKGCYIGQETVARAKYRGINKRAMFILQGTGSSLPQSGSALEMQLENGWRQTGCIINAVQYEGKLYLLAVLNQEIEAQTALRLPDDHSPLQILPLPYTLA
ncbi:folate-binding protein YgfZ [Haemophilus pittmaniae HK 85]|uniref:Folate-binding protein YgfZ n=1 Tax=Haemophilus pittmaniae HK 85 TaxID=1035188 RepID=F9Q6Q9_9PAST|nr:folate-binding protein YgfZ [Haemophilus pittmaniae]EGV07099.1 folate-binding protein YgfZ [Haemophilus pittmaniae HK 85]SNV56973.1 folate-dependent regulatory protein [Haemophilus pittmaniae]